MRNSALVGATLFCSLLFSSTESNAQWVPTAGRIGGAIASVAVSGTNLYACTNDSGIYLSTNSGANWMKINTGLTVRNVTSLAISGTNLFAGMDLGGIFLSSNNGTSWTEVNSGLTNTRVHSLEFVGTNLFAGTDDGVFLSANNGTNWVRASSGINSTDVTIWSLASVGTSLFAGTNSNAYRSTDNGASWTTINSGLPQYPHILCFAVIGTNLFAGTNGGGIFLTQNNGANWTQVGSALSVTQVYSLAVSGTNLFAGTGSKGVYLSTNSGTSWTQVSSGLPNNSVYTLAASGTDLFAGLFVSGMWRRPLSEMVGSPSGGTALTLTDVTTGVDTLWVSGTPGPLFPLSASAIPVVAGNELSSSAPSTVAMASTLGAGRVIALGHDGFVNDANVTKTKNMKFATNAMAWLDRSNTKRIAMTTGHSEFVTTNATSFVIRLQQLGYSVTTIPSPVTATAISGSGVVFVGNAWGNFTQSELDALNAYVQQGGGLFLLGLGWSYLGYNPGKTLDDYPMNKIAGNSGIRWMGGSISDPVRNLAGSPYFTAVYPNIQAQTVPSATAYIDSVTSSQAAGLPVTLQSNAVVRARYSNAHLLLGAGSTGLPTSHSLRQTIYDFYKSFISRNSSLFAKGQVFDTTTQSTMAYVRGRAQRTFCDVLPLTSSSKSEIAQTLGFTGRYLDLWNTYGVILQDNSMLSTAQKEEIYQFLGNVPATLHNLRSISVKDFLGTPARTIPLDGVGGYINIFGTQVGSHNENEFPADVQSQLTDLYTIALAHEVNHIVDAFYVAGNSTLSSRKNALIAAAGSDPLNYLRSQLPSGFFVQSPQEFFASISNEWFCNSEQTIRLGVSRFRSGRPQPLNQALFFANVYSLGGNTTNFYTIDQQGRITKSSAKLGRNGAGFVNSLSVRDSLYSFVLDSQGNVTGFNVASDVVQEGERNEVPTTFSLSQNFPNPFNPSTTIQYRVSHSSDVTLRVFNALGQLVATLVDQHLNAGTYSVDWNASTVPSGIYFCRLQAGTIALISKMVVIK